ncbi:MAG: 30S ribosomal protein S12 methylthiotransferase RimO [Clostridiaceae bacterium]|nr:30S ribosomal protein S12 methylthiotransferase RimO [Clostridiaceae bacterium]
MIGTSDIPNKSFYLLSLGCAKNLVDAECMSQMLRNAGLLSVDQPGNADFLIVNTCGFIASAKQEAINAILNLADFKAPQGHAKALIVTGCLAQRYAEKIRQQLPEVDAVLGTAEYAKIVEVVRQLDAGCGKSDHKPGKPGSLDHLKIDRNPSTPGTYAYIKIAEGCSNHCTYCAIPGIRGELCSRPEEDIVAEADRLSREGYQELILIAQDSGRYGLDLYGERHLTSLLKKLCALRQVRLIRILYIYSDGLTDDLIHLLVQEKKIAHYLDMPIQHASNRLLRSMNRRDTQESIREAIQKIRAAIPDLILRTTVMVGFPGETEDDFQILLGFLNEIRFDRLGCFIFSPEEGTAAFTMKPRVRKQTAERRYRQLMKLQQDISCVRVKNRLGTVLPVTLESLDDRGIFYVGRSYGEAPDVDPVIYVAGTTDQELLGQTVPVRLVDGDDYDMTGVTVL